LLLWALSAVALLSGLASGSFAGTNFVGGIHFNTGLPQEQLEDQIGRNAYGIGGQIFYAPSTSPFAVGLDLCWMNYGVESRREPFSTTIPDVEVDVETWNNVVQAFFVLRGQMPRGPIQLYADALIGLNYLFTETKIQDTGNVVESVISSTNRDDTAFAYGFGGGVMVPVYTGMRASGDEDDRFEVSLDAGARYLRGDEAEYLKKGSIRRSDGKVTFDSLESRTDIVRLHVGVAVRW